MATRAPKKKKGGASEGPLTNDIVNIFKDKPDPVIHPSDAYPVWLMEHLDKKYSPPDVMM